MDGLGSPAWSDIARLNNISETDSKSTSAMQKVMYQNRRKILRLYTVLSFFPQHCISTTDSFKSIFFCSCVHIIIHDKHCYILNCAKCITTRGGIFQYMHRFSGQYWWAKFPVFLWLILKLCNILSKYIKSKTTN